MVSGFRASGIFPLNREQVLKHLPSADPSRDSGGERSTSALSDSVMSQSFTNALWVGGCWS